MASSTDNGVAATILQQLSHFNWNHMVAMCGVKHVLGSKDYVSFQFMKGTDKINGVKIILTLADEYTMIFFRIHGTSCKEVKKIEHAQAEDLNRLFRATTGLDTSL